MAITATIVRNAVQPNGKQIVFVSFSDGTHTLKRTTIIAPGVDAQTYLNAQIPRIENAFKRREIGQAMDLIDDETALKAFMQGALYATPTNVLRAIGKQVMLLDDVELALKAKVLLDWLRNDYTNGQLLSLFNIPAPKLSAFANRVDLIAANANTLRTDPDWVEDDV